MSFTIELNFYFICYLYIRATYRISKKICSLRNKIYTILSLFQNSTQTTESNSLTYTCISWYDIKESGMYWKKNHKRLTSSISAGKLSRYVWPRKRKFSPYLCGDFTWYCTLLYCINRYTVPSGNFFFHFFLEFDRYNAHDDVIFTLVRRVSVS